ncbi:beta,beta-carotene 15,15'-dioxygenase-like isoform X2 [Biomphalaria glabrata]|uniref:Beta,beta-carotene 15,15'-dioxygenase-like isoform X2 n=1 Tax=Biomphalaria glabrata TaxID=6526 RepID=A0A9W2YLS2_BIOGL|nr:beta,beta-carotene 15,15'-dioxygenase-like isoform X2 [Biomphalaria glabrata]
MLISKQLSRWAKYYKDCARVFSRRRKVFMAGAKKLKLPQYFDLDSSSDFNAPIEAPVTGRLPGWLCGSLYRNGSGIYRIKETTWKHAFDGLAVLHRWTIKDGNVTYMSSVLDSDHYKKCIKFDRLVGGNFGTTFPDPCQSIFKRFFSRFIPTPPDKSDNTAVSLMQYGDRLLALTETTAINDINPDTLKKKGQVDLQSSLVIHMGTAHPHVEKDGSFLYYGTNMGCKKTYNFIHVPVPQPEEPLFKNAKILATIPSQWKGGISYIHSFGMTEKYIVHFENPLVINGWKILTLHMKMTSIENAMNSMPEHPINVVVIAKATGKKVPVTYQAPHGFVFHFINCYEEQEHIVCDVCLYKDAQIVKELYLESLCDKEYSIVSNPCFARFVLPLGVDETRKGENLVKLKDTKATATLSALSKAEPVLFLTCDYMFGERHVFELPRINCDYNAGKYRYAYGTSSFNKKTRKLYKFDLEESKVLEWPCDDYHFPGEPVFVARPNNQTEDDGVILCPIVASSVPHESYLLVLDATTMCEVARATLSAETKMNYSFHGLFIREFDCAPEPEPVCPSDHQSQVSTKEENSI